MAFFCLEILSQRDGRTDRRMDRQMDGQMDGWMDRWMDGRTDGWTDRMADRRDVQIPPVFYRTLSPPVLSGADALLTS